ncbi:MAG: cellulase family glycosylhydrolase, partial [Ruminococcus sp.]|nr:cellulase family glycosylhydrolase [Ruminococcus sp.]
MINIKKALAVCSAVLLTGLSTAVPVYATAESVPDEYHDDWLHVNENAEIVDMYGNPVWLTGCNWFGYNVGSQVFDGVWSQNMHDMLRQIADHGFNLLRVPMSTELLLQWKNGDPDPATPKVNEYSNPELTLEGIQGGTIMYSFDIWNQAVAWCRELGIKIMIDIHCAETASAGHQVSLWYTDKYSTEDWLEALEWVSDYYKDDDTIIAMDIKNEPHGTADTPNLMAKWDNSTDLNNWKYAAERGAEAVMKANPNLLVMVEGVEVYPKFEEGADWTSQNIDYSRYPYSYYHHTWWGGNFRGVKDYPLDLGEHQSQLVYSPHDYGPLVFEQEWFKKDFNSETLMEDVWRDNWF